LLNLPSVGVSSPMIAMAQSGIYGKRSHAAVDRQSLIKAVLRVVLTTKLLPWSAMTIGYRFKSKNQQGCGIYANIWVKAFDPRLLRF
jgi:hypothetical protein